MYREECHHDTSAAETNPFCANKAKERFFGLPNPIVVGSAAVESKLASNLRLRPRTPLTVSMRSNEAIPDPRRRRRPPPRSGLTDQSPGPVRSDVGLDRRKWQ